jgi:hypothetical protein
LTGSHAQHSTARIPSGLLGMLLMVLTIEAVISGHRSDLMTPWAEDWRISALAAETKSIGCEVLCFGDSLIKQGVLPRVIEARTGLRTFNLATSGGTTPSAYFLFRRALDSGARPRAVVVDFAALMVQDDDRTNLRNYPDLATVRDCLDLTTISGDFNFLASLAVSKLLPSYRWRFELRTGVQASLDGRGCSQQDILRFYRALWDREAGAQPSHSPRIFHPREDFLIEGHSPKDWTCDPKDQVYIERFLALAESHRIAVYWLLPPMAPAVHARQALRGSNLAYDRFVRSIAAKHPGTVVLDARNSRYDDSVHIDFLHLDHRGASVLSADLATVVMEGLAARSTPGIGWLVMPPLDGRTGNEPRAMTAGSRSSTSR